MKRSLALLGLVSVVMVVPLTSSSAAPIRPQDMAMNPAPVALNQLATAARATTKFHKLAVAKKAGYAKFKDAAGIACIANKPDGAMGIHYVRGDIVGDGAVKARTPEALVYEKRNGHKHLVALEYVVLAADWDAKHTNPPKLFGQEFMFTAEGNRYGLPDFYSLHVWIWKFNPSGLFAMWNPNVHCHGAGS